MLCRTKTWATVIGIMLSAGITIQAVADPDQSQRLRGLGGRTFAVEVTNITGNGPPPGTFSNCYVFNDDGSWIDPFFTPLLGVIPPIPGTWTQDSTGAKTSYTATASFPIGGGLAVLLEQEGTVTPAGGMGTLQLEAFTRVTLIVAATGTLVFPLDNFVSLGHQDNDCT